MKYNDLIKKHGIKPGEPGTKKIYTMINEMEGIESELVLAKEQIAGGSLSAAKRKAMEKDVKIAEEALPEMDQALCDVIELWLPRREEFANKAKNLQKGKGVKNAATASSAGGSDTPPAGAVPSQANATSAGPTGNKAKAQASSENQSDSNAAAPGDKKKNRSGWGWLLGAAAVLALAVVGVNVANRAK